MKNVYIIFLLFITFLICNNCTPKKQHNQTINEIHTYKDFINKGYKFGVQMGDIYGNVVKDIFKTNADEYMNVYDLLEAVKIGKIDAAVIDNSYVRQLKESGSFPDFEFMLIPEEEFVNLSAVLFHKEDLRIEYNKWLAGIKIDGTLEEITNRWLGVPLPEYSDIPKFTLPGENGILTVCDTGDYPPFSYYSSDGEIVGFNYDMLNRFAEYTGRKLEIIIMNYAGILPAIASGKADMSACVFTITEERADNVLFGDPCVISQGTLVYKK